MDNAVYVSSFLHPADYSAGAFMCAQYDCAPTKLVYPGSMPCSGLNWPWEGKVSALHSMPSPQHAPALLCFA